MLADARDLDPAERDALAASQVRRIPATADAFRAALSGLGDLPVYLHVDVDIMDSTEIPGLRFPSGPGPSLGDIENCLTGWPVRSAPGSAGHQKPRRPQHLHAADTTVSLAETGTCSTIAA